MYFAWYLIAKHLTQRFDHRTASLDSQESSSELAIVRSMIVFLACCVVAVFVGNTITSLENRTGFCNHPIREWTMYGGHYPSAVEQFRRWTSQWRNATIALPRHPTCSMWRQLYWVQLMNSWGRATVEIYLPPNPTQPLRLFLNFHPGYLYGYKLSTQVKEITMRSTVLLFPSHFKEPHCFAHAYLYVITWIRTFGISNPIHLDPVNYWWVLIRIR